MATVVEMSKIETRTGIDGRRYWCVMIKSAATGRWIVQGEYLTEDAAKNDLRNWR